MSLSNMQLRWPKELAAPFDTVTRKLYPKNMHEALCWAEEFWTHHGFYTSAIQKAVRQFLSDIEVTSRSEESEYRTTIKYRDALLNDLDIINRAAEVGDEYFGFGNVITSVHTPFVRHLYCPSCGSGYPVKSLHGSYKWDKSKQKFTMSCPNARCSYSGAHVVKDYRNKERPMVIKTWPVQYISLNKHVITGRSTIALDCSRYETLVQGINLQDPLYMEETPLEFMKAVSAGKRFIFDENSVYHLANPTVACMTPGLKGWGLPPFMADFELALLVYMLDKYVEVIVSDYLVPFRVITPAALGGGESDNPLQNLNMGDFMGHVKGMLEKHRRNPTDWNFLPHPLQYHTMGGEAGNIIPIEIQEHFERKLLSIMGIPSSIREGQSNADPLLEYKTFSRTWSRYISSLDKWLTWVSNKQGALEQWEQVTVKLTSPDIEEDPGIQQLKMDLASAGQGSRQDAYRAIGWDWRRQILTAMDEASWEAEEIEYREEQAQKKMANKDILRQPSEGEVIMQQEEEAMMAQQEQAGMPPPMGMQGGMPGGMASPLPQQGGSATMDDLLAQADQYAHEILTMDQLSRNRQLAALKQGDEVLYAQTKARLQQLETEAGQQGKMLARQGQLPVQ